VLDAPAHLFSCELLEGLSFITPETARWLGTGGGEKGEATRGPRHTRMCV